MSPNCRRWLLSVALAVAASLFDANSTLAKAGYFSVAEIDGVWWFIEPNGEPFFSLGINDIGPGPSREAYNPQRPAYAAFRYYNSTQQWAEHTLQRLTDWKFNTIGGWADALLIREPMPYTVVLHLEGNAAFLWQDIFSDRFEEKIDELARKHVAPRSRDRNLLGWFSDNELSWYPAAIFQYHLGQPGTVTRAKLLKLLVDHYQHDFAALERDFEVAGAANFDELARGGQLKPRPGSNAHQIISLFSADVARRYYQVVHDAIRRYDTNHLILGDRYARHCPDVVAKAAVPYVDVISVNVDWPDATDGYLPSGYLQNLHQVTGKPVLVTEYYVAAADNRSGNKNSGAIFLTVATQQDRAAAFENRLRILARQPYVVGAHWFRFADEPPHGRPSDGEDYNFGLVDIDNQPYEELTAAMTRVHRDVPQLHRESLDESSSDPDVISVPRVRAGVGDLHKQLVEARSLTPQDESLRMYDLLAAWTPKQLYLAALVWDGSERESYSHTPPRTDQEFEITIDSPAMDSPVRIAFGNRENVSCDTSAVQCRLSVNRLHYTLVVALPAAVLNRPFLQADERWPIAILLNNSVTRQSTACERTLLLGATTEQAGPPATILPQAIEGGVQGSPAAAAE